MKRYTVLLTGLILTLGACAQKNVPQNVEMAFKKQFPNAQKVSWDKENAKEWEAEFKMDGIAYSVNFSTDGKWMETEYKVKTADLPARVNETLARDFASYKVHKAEVSETNKGTVYEVELKGEEDMEVVMDANGKVMKKMMEDEENDYEEND